ncbi:MAG: hypothetical protein NC078_08400 [Ruminococcus sp.]|nr:hypothetical protein [Ruminococcus sp.]
MTRRELKADYFDWLYRLVCSPEDTGGHSYGKLLARLDQEEFTYIIGLDGNRAEDGMDLRYRFGYECGIADSVTAAFLDDRSCSVLEMMAALSLRCEEHIMDDSESGLRPGRWFWKMIKNLGLYSMTDAHYDEETVNNALFVLLSHGYKSDGEGGLFTVKNPKSDMRTAEIWAQMMWYLNQTERNERQNE